MTPRVCLAGVAVLLGCNVPAPPRSTGGVLFAEAEADGAAVAPGGCERGVVIVESDYNSTNIVVSRLDGTTLSGSFVSSGATKPGLALALSGDVDVPFVAPASKRLVLIDRYGTNVITWMKVETAEVLAQLPVGQGFESNPHDYIEVDATHAWISRYGHNPTPGREPFDEGADLLIVDTAGPAIVGRIAIAEDDPRLTSSPGEMAWVGPLVVVTLGRWSPDFSLVGDGRFVGVSVETSEVVWKVDLPGLASCGRVALSPSGKRLAIACAGKFDFVTNRVDTSHSDLVLFDATTTPPTELQRFGVAARLAAGLGPQVAFASESQLLATVSGGNSTAGDRAFSLDITTGDITPLLEARKAFVLGGMRCSPGCGDVCLLSDAQINVIRRWKVGAAGLLEPLADATTETVVGLPPRTMGGI